MHPKKMCGAVVVVLGTIAGFAMVAVGLSSVTGQPSPSADFNTLSSPCVVVGVYRHEELRNKHNHATKQTETHCYDVYTYEFAWCNEDGNACSPATAPSSIGDTTPIANYTPSWSSAAEQVAVYRGWWTSFPPPAAFVNAGWESELLVSEGDDFNRGAAPCSRRRRALGHTTASALTAGSWVTCYVPSKATVSDDYSCGNTRCVKLFDPALDPEITAASRQGKEALYFGIGVAALFSLIWLCMWRNAGYSCRAFFCGDDDDDSSSESDAGK